MYLCNNCTKQVFVLKMTKIYIANIMLYLLIDILNGHHFETLQR